MGALKKGLNPRAHELGLYICGGRGRQSRNTPDELRAIAERTGLDGDALVRTSRLTARIDNNAIADGFQIYLHSFVADRRRRLGGRAAGDERRRAGWRAAITGTRPRCATSPPTRTRRSSVRTPGRSATSSIGGRGPAQEALLAIARDDPAKTLADVRRLEMPSRHDVRAERRQREAARRRAGARARARAARLRLVPAARTARAAHAAVAGADRRGGARRADALRRSGALLVRARRQGRSSVSGAAHGLRRVDRGAAPGARRGQARPHRQAARPGAARCLHAARSKSGRTPDADVEATIAHERAISPSLGGRTVFDDTPAHAAGRVRKGQLHLFAR